MGRGGRADAQHLPDGARAFRGIASEEGMGAVHGPSHRSGRPLWRRESRREVRSRQGRGVPRLGRVGRKARREAEQGAWFESARFLPEEAPRPFSCPHQFLTPLSTRPFFFFPRLFFSILPPPACDTYCRLTHQWFFFFFTSSRLSRSIGH